MEPTNGEPVVKKPATKEPTGRGTCSQACNQGAFSPGVTQSRSNSVRPKDQGALYANVP